MRWQQRTIEHARQTGHTRTLMGRYRELPGIGGRTPALRAHAERAAINTPIQGGAADVMTLAMLKLDRSEKLKELGFKMLLQASDRTQMGNPESHGEGSRFMTSDPDASSPLPQIRSLSRAFHTPLLNLRSTTR